MNSKYFSDPAVAKDVLSETFQRVVQDPGIGESLKGLDQLVAFDYTQDDPSLLFWMDARGGQVSIGTDQPPEPATVTMVSSLDVGHQSWSNKLNPMMAIATRKIKPKGNATSLLKLAPLLKKIAPIYNQVLDDKGLGDIKL
jgi:putative sterol carrier protein